MFKKIISFILLSMLSLLAIFYTSKIIYAESINTINIVVDTKKGLSGSEVKIGISLDNNPGITSLMFDVEYDESLLSLESVYYNQEMGGQWKPNDIYNSPINLTWASPFIESKYNGVFVTLTFKVSAEAVSNQVGNINITCNKEDIFNLNKENIECNIDNGQIIVTTDIPGDINGDGKVNAKDATRLFQYISGWNVEVNELSLDINGDGKVNAKDATRLFQYVSGWDVEINEGEASHVHTMNKTNSIDPTCTNDGNIEYYTCTSCNKLYGDINATNEISLEEISIKKVEHDFVNRQCTICDKYDVSKGLEYMLNTDGKSYTVKKGTCADVNVVIPDTYEGLPVTNIDNSAFSGYTNLESIEIPNSVISIGSFAFKSCTKLTNVEIPNSVRNLSSYAFQNCTNLTNVKISNSVTWIGSNTFQNCTKLITIELPNSISTIESYTFSGCINLEKIVIASDVKELGEYAFSGCTNLKEVEFKDNGRLTIIGKYAFNNCTSLENIYIPNTITSIGYGSFDGCTNVKQLVFERNSQLISIDSYAFKNCTNLTSVEIPNSVLTIGVGAFSGCNNIVSISLPFVGQSRVATGSAGVFGYIFGYETSNSGSYYSGPLTTQYKYLDAYDSLNSYTYRYNIPSSIKNVTITDAIKLYGEYYEYVYPQTSGNRKLIEGGAFYNCNYIENITINDEVEDIGVYAFNGCTSLTNIEIPSNVKELKGNVLKNCTNLKEVSFGENSILTTINADAFYNCISLTSIEIPSSVTGIGGQAYCRNLTNLYYNGTIEEWCTLSFSNSYSTPITFYMIDSKNEYYKLTEVIIPNTITTIYGQFANFVNLTKVVIPSSVTSISNNAFSGCTNLTIYCEVLSKPSGWNSNWNSSSRPVVWGYTGE